MESNYLYYFIVYDSFIPHTFSLTKFHLSLFFCWNCHPILVYEDPTLQIMLHSWIYASYFMKRIQYIPAAILRHKVTSSNYFLQKTLSLYQFQLTCMIMLTMRLSSNKDWAAQYVNDPEHGIAQNCSTHKVLITSLKNWGISNNIQSLHNFHCCISCLIQTDRGGMQLHNFHLNKFTNLTFIFSNNSMKNMNKHSKCHL